MLLAKRRSEAGRENRGSAIAVRELCMSFRSIRTAQTAWPFGARKSHPIHHALDADITVIVSGLPRSGTSLMQQMLTAGGMEALTDGKRSPDRDNSNGYFEWEPIKQISKDHRILGRPEVRGKAIKVISTLLPELPKAYQYKVLFMERDIDEIVASQTLMLTANNKPEASQDQREMQRQLAAHNENILAWVGTASHIDLLMLSYREMIRNPAPQIAKIAAFLGPDALPHPEAMAGAIDSSLYRNRKPGILKRLTGFGRS